MNQIPRAHIDRIGLGLAALGRPGYINIGHSSDLDGEYAVDRMEVRAHRVLDAAFDSGIRYFDVARSYGRSEVFLANWIEKRKLKTGAVRTGSKWGYKYTADWQIDAEVHEQKEHSLERLNTQWAESQAILGEHLNLYQIHSATLESGVLQKSDVLRRLATLKNEGVNIGLSVSGPEQCDVIREAIDTTVDGVRLFDAVQATWNLLETSAGAALSDAHKAGLRVIVKETLANGRLTIRNANISRSGTLHFLHATAERHRVTVDALAVASVLSQAWADTVLVGAARVDHLHSNLKAIDLTIGNDTLLELAEMAEISEEYWTRRSALSWN